MVVTEDKWCLVEGTQVLEQSFCVVDGRMALWTWKEPTSIKILRYQRTPVTENVTSCKKCILNLYSCMLACKYACISASGSIDTVSTRGQWLLKLRCSIGNVFAPSSSYLIIQHSLVDGRRCSIGIKWCLHKC